MQEQKSGWENVDVSSKAEHYIYLMDREKSLASVQHYTAMTYAMLDLKEGSSVVDVGCGTASDAINLYNIVGPQGKVVGVDYSQKLIDEAKKRVAQANLPIDLYVGDAHQLTMFACDSFDAARATAVFHHLQDPAIALQEMIRIVRPGGIILIGELDWETLLIDHPNVVLTRKIANYHCDHKVRNGWMGRQLPGLFKRSGLVDVQVAPGNLILNYQFLNLLVGLEKMLAGMAEKKLVHAEAQEWLSDLQSFDREDRLFASLSGFITFGRKP